MKKLALYATIVSLIISLIYSFKVYWIIETEFEFYRATFITLVSEIGLWCAYYYARDYEGTKAHEERAKRITQHFAMMSQPDEEPEQKQ